MSWLEKLLPPKIQRTDPAERRTVPEGLWIKCPSCETVLYKTDLEQNVNVCPKCDHHHRIGARERLNAFLDAEGRWEIGQEVLPVDALKFKDSKKYPERLKAALETTGETDALVVMGGSVMSVPLVAACFEFDFMGGSMGSVVGERFVRGVEAAVEQKVPFVSFTATGGALTATLPVTTELGTVETFVLARIAYLPAAPRFTQLAPLQAAPTAPKPGPAATPPPLLPPQADSTAASNTVDDHNKGFEILLDTFILLLLK